MAVNSSNHHALSRYDLRTSQWIHLPRGWWFVLSILLELHSPDATSQIVGTYRVFFRDKGPGVFLPGSILYQAAEQNLDRRARARRAKVLSPDSIITFSDAPVYGPYLDDLTRSGARVLFTLRWRNYAVVECDSVTASILRTKQYIASVEPTSAVLRPQTHIQWWRSNALSPSYNYGASLEQIGMVGLSTLHALGITGENTLIGLIDTGFRWRTHEALRNSRVVAEYDFIQLDSITANQDGDHVNQDSHGTAVFSVIAGWYPDSLIGGAPCASFVLAKTENVASERRIEEDALAAAIEWMEAQGVDVVNISLGYSTFDSTEVQYVAQDFNGRTTIASVAVEEAVRRGMVCVVAAGNNGDAPTTIYSPGEAPHALTVGAVANTQLDIPRFTSRGPTVDGRLKPDLAALGVNVRTTTNASPLGFGLASGTSMATPIITSCVAALLQAHPELTPSLLRELLTTGASHSHDPNTAVGYGVPDVYRSAIEWGIVCSPPIVIPRGDSVFIGLAAASIVPVTSAELRWSLRQSFGEMPLRSAGSLMFALLPRQGVDSLVFWFTLTDGQRTKRHPTSGTFYARTSDTLLPCGWQLQDVSAIVDRSATDKSRNFTMTLALPIDQPYLILPQRWQRARCSVFDLQLRNRWTDIISPGERVVRIPIDQRGTFIVRIEYDDGTIVSYFLMMY